MIISDLKHWRQEAGWVTPSLRKALEWLEQQISTDTPAGRYDIDGDRMYVLVQELTTEPAVERLAEAHRKYIDIQLLLSGKELIRAARDSDSAEIIADELLERDKLSYRDVEHESDIVLLPGMFAVFFPADIHRPCCNAERSMFIRKAVVKIDVSLL